MSDIFDLLLLLARLIQVRVNRELDFSVVSVAGVAAPITSHALNEV